MSVFIRGLRKNFSQKLRYNNEKFHEGKKSVVELIYDLKWYNALSINWFFNHFFQPHP